MTDSEHNFFGHIPQLEAEHRTVGPHRAWCDEWCYPSDPCARCAEWLRSRQPCPHCTPVTEVAP